jgi:hypothetical protein
MRELIKKLDAEYGFHLTDAEVELIIQQAERADDLLRQLQVLDFPELAPLMKVDRQERHDRK